jgi:hypothetical protein
MSRNWFLLVLILGWTYACNNTESEENIQDETSETEEGRYFGERITEEGAIPFETLLSYSDDIDSLPAKVLGTVETVCQTKGCWMNLIANTEAGQSMKVTFKDYGFFMPKDIAGRQVIVDGYVYREVSSVDELRHYAEDEGLTQEEINRITEPIEELKFLAHGVILLDPKEGE